MFFDGWDVMLETALRSAVAYLVIVGTVRVLGDRAVAKMTAYDVIVTIVVGAIVAGIPLAQTALANTVMALLVIVGLHEAIRFVQAHVRRRPRLVVWRGELLRERLRRWRIKEPEVHAAIRRAGVASIAEVQAVVLENDGEWSVVKRVDCGVDRSAFEGLELPT